MSIYLRGSSQSFNKIFVITQKEFPAVQNVNKKNLSLLTNKKADFINLIKNESYPTRV